MLLPETNFCHRCIDRQIAQVATAVRLVSDPADQEAERLRLNELVGKRMMMLEEKRTQKATHEI